LNHDHRFNALVSDGRFTGNVLFDPEHLYKVLFEREPKRVFVNEFSDLFHESVPDQVVIEHFRVFNAAHWHQFQALTKRAERLVQLNEPIMSELGAWPSNLWQGVSVCSASEVELQRIDSLGATGAIIKWISFEPWISNVNKPLRESVRDLRSILQRNQIAWTVVGGESGSRNDSNLMLLDDARYLVEESRAAGCRVHFKQLGTALAIQLCVPVGSSGPYTTCPLPSQRIIIGCVMVLPKPSISFWIN
jgi:protein gp37